jgi:ABC-type nitrate/sulfonate/bicarbonate transport system substrate-binding protein
MKKILADFNRRKNCFKLAAVVAGAIFAAPASAQAPQPAPVKIKVGYIISTDMSVLPFLHALKTGQFKKAGLDVDAKAFAQSSLKYDTFKAGGIDIDVNMGVINAAQLHTAGVPVLVLRAAQSADQWAIIVKKDSPIKTPQAWNPFRCHDFFRHQLRIDVPDDENLWHRPDPRHETVDLAAGELAGSTRKE